MSDNKWMFVYYYETKSTSTFDKQLPARNQNIHPDLQHGSQRMLIQTPINQRESVSHG